MNGRSFARHATLALALCLGGWAATASAVPATTDGCVPSNCSGSASECKKRCITYPTLQVEATVKAAQHVVGFSNTRRPPV